VAQFSIDPNYLRELIVKLRAVMAKEANDVPDIASDAIDDDLPPDEFQEEEDDLSREEVIEELQGMSADEQAQLVALMWLGREDDNTAEDWNDLMQQARDRRDTPTEDYLLEHPQLTDFWLEGMEKLGLGGLVDDVGEISPNLE
jgi:hypothetical protein